MRNGLVLVAPIALSGLALPVVALGAGLRALAGWVRDRARRAPRA